MPETYTVVGHDYMGEKDNPHGGRLYKFKVALEDSAGVTHPQVYWQRKSSEGPSGEVYGDITDGEFGPRFRTAQRPDGSGSQGSSGGTFTASRYQKEGMTKDDYWGAKNERDIEGVRRMGRAHAQDMGLRAMALLNPSGYVKGRNILRSELLEWTDWFDADVGGGNGTDAPLAPAADVSAGPEPVRSSPMQSEVSTPEASPAQKARLTKEFGKKGLSRDAMKAVVLYRCRSEKATKDGASKLIQDLMDGATHDTLMAEIHDAKRAGDPLAIRAAKLIPPDVPLAKDPNEKAKDYEDESGVPF